MEFPPTLGDVINALAALAERLPDGPDAELDAGVCDGHGLTTTSRFEVTTLTEVTQAGAPRAPRPLIRVHTHGADAVYRPGVAEAVDEG